MLTNLKPLAVFFSSNFFSWQGLAVRTFPRSVSSIPVGHQAQAAVQGPCGSAGPNTIIGGGAMLLSLGLQGCAAALGTGTGVRMGMALSGDYDRLWGSWARGTWALPEWPAKELLLWDQGQEKVGKGTKWNKWFFMNLNLSECRCLPADLYISYDKYSVLLIAVVNLGRVFHDSQNSNFS